MATKWEVGERVLQHWEIRRIIKGGMGVVYVTLHVDDNKLGVMKTFNDEVFLHNPRLAERFLKEALTWVNLDRHQNITTATGAFYHEGKPYLSLEYVGGGDLSSWIGTRLSGDLPQVLRFAIQFCDGMTHALSKGLRAHRDIKPQNCLITEDGMLKVTDFGLATMFDDVNTDWPVSHAAPAGQLAVGLTRTGVAAGTCTHMAPEQFLDAKHVDVRADVYSFGIMLYQMITGRLPFIGQTWKELELQHRKQPPPVMVLRDDGLRELINGCLAKDPANRLANFSDIREKLSDIYERLTGERAHPPVVGEELDPFNQYGKGLNCANLGLPEMAIANYDRAIEINKSDEKLWINKYALMGKAKELSKLGRLVEALVCCNRALEITLQPELRYIDKFVWQEKAEVLSGLGRVDEALACHDWIIEHNPLDSMAWIGKAALAGRHGLFEELVACSKRALDLHPDNVWAWLYLGLALKAKGKVEDALLCYDRALEINPEFEEAWIRKAEVMAASGRFKEALACIDRVIEISPFNSNALAYRSELLKVLSRSER